MQGWIAIFLIIIIIVGLEVLYHKIFRVVYLGFGALMQELMVCFVISLLIVGVLLKPFLSKTTTKTDQPPTISEKTTSQVPPKNIVNPTKVGDAQKEGIASASHDYNVQLTYAKPFKEGLAWVEFVIDGGEACWGVIDKEGKLVFMLPGYDAYPPDILEFSNGYTNVPYSHEKLDVYNRDGLLVHSHPIDEKNKVLAYGDGYVYTREDVRSFDSSDCMDTIYGPEGEVLNVTTIPAEFWDDEVDYLGQGVFWTSDGVYFAQVDQWIYDLPDGSWYVVSDFGDDIVAICIYSIPVEEYWDEYIQGVDKPPLLYCLYSDGHVTQKEMKNLPSTRLDTITNWIGVWSSGSELILYDFKTDTALPLPAEYEGRWSDRRRYGLLDNQNIAVELLGDDDSCYVLLFDKNWNRIAEPIKGTLHGCGENIFVCSENGEHIVYNANGQRLYSVEAKGYHYN